ncbi:hypothetical protein [Candidatus Enterococcus mansonii]|uniref:Uncharacterized protein n=1 Tax=Candidatus Enterococcus mansonii TaxID=1834181 RepID=A0A242CEI4_9ENTE|nr:hypothetical protein [Enterococcus sp. 4G2_DIV0659]OTO08647.1 hypothetical protein A5880_001647 [Enterococcus sp. 4G2_DIV0659]
MIGMTLVEESNHLLRSVDDVNLLDVLKENCFLEELSFDRYDYDTNSFLDLIDYTEFQDYTEYVFVSLSKSVRLPRIIHFLNSFSEVTKFHYISIDESSNETIEQLIDREKLIAQEKVDESSDIILKNGLMALFTGVYPRIFRKNIIKHLYVEHGKDLANIHPSVYLNCAINHGVYIDESRSVAHAVKRCVPSIVVYKDSIKTFVKEVELEELSEEKLKQQLEIFANTGTITWQERKNGIIDYSEMLSLGLERRLFVFEDGIYLDYRRTKKLFSDISRSFAEIELVKSRFKKKTEKNGLYEVFPVLINLAISLNDNHLSFITPFNNNQFEAIYLEAYPSEWIVLSTSEGYLAFHSQSNRTFEVNQLFVEIFEAQVKGCTELIKDKNSEITDEMIKEHEELMLSV